MFSGHPPMKCTFIAIVAACALGCQLLSNQVVSKGDAATVRGVVTDPMDAVIPRVSVVFAGQDEERIAVTTYDGSYEISLEPGTYEVTARLAGFCPGHRSAIRLLENSEAQVDFQLVDCGFINWIEIPVIDPAAPIRPPRAEGNLYGEEKLNPIPATGLRPLVLYGRREEKGDSTLYFGLLDNKRQLPAVFTYNLITLRATTLIYSNKDYSIEALGGVVWKDGKQAWRGSRIKVALNEESPKTVLRE
jgi:hypothetical protein